MKSNEVGVFIKGLKMPPSCCDCDMIELSGAIGCRHAYDMKNSDLDRASDCPLVPVPPHGRLINADVQDAQIEALIERHLHGYTKSTWDFVCELRDILKRNRTIIPGEEAEDA